MAKPKGKIRAKRHARLRREGATRRAGEAGPGKRRDREEAKVGTAGAAERGAGRVQQRQGQEGAGGWATRRGASGYVLCLSNWIAFHAVASNGPITVADGRPTYMAPEISLLRGGLEKLIRFPL